MKRLVTPFIILLILTLVIGCETKTNTQSAGQQKAIKNSIEFIKNSSFTSKDLIDTDIVDITDATENTWKSVSYKGSKVEEKAVDSTDWIITIGDTKAHNFASIVCDSKTYKVIGFIPTE
jgi:hypothetical protein